MSADIEIPDFTRHEFIRRGIRDEFKSKGLKIADIMTRSYHSQLRNAFAHSDYDFFKTNCISLNNYKGEPHEMPEITYEQWDERFTLSMLLFNQVAAHISKFKKEIGERTDGKGIEVWVPDRQGILIKDHLWYDAYYGRYLWEYQREDSDPK